MKYLSITQTAERWGISTRRIQILCAEGRVPGAIRIGTDGAFQMMSQSPQTQESKAESMSRNPLIITSEPQNYQQP